MKRKGRKFLALLTMVAMFFTYSFSASIVSVYAEDEQGEVVAAEVAATPAAEAEEENAPAVEEAAPAAEAAAPAEATPAAEKAVANSEKKLEVKEAEKIATDAILKEFNVSLAELLENVELKPISEIEKPIEGVEIGEVEVDKIGTIDIESWEGPYDGEAHSIKVVKIYPRSSNTQEKRWLEYRVEGEQTWSKDNPSFTEVGTYTVHVRYTNGLTKPHLAEGSGTVTITEPGLTIEKLHVECYNGEYDGKPHGVLKTYTDTLTEPPKDNEVYYLVEGGSWTTEAPSFTDAGSYPVQVRWWDGKRGGAYAEGKGTVVITPVKLTVEITGNTDTVLYDGSSHTVKGFTWTATNSAGEDCSSLVDVKYNHHGDPQVSSDAEGTHYMMVRGHLLGENDFVVTTTGDSSNYDITVKVTPGWLKITRLKVTGWSGPYDAEEHGVKVEFKKPSDAHGTVYFAFSEDGETWSDWTTDATAGPKYTDAGTYTVYVKVKIGGAVFNDKAESATVEINPCPVTLIVNESTVKEEYNGKTQNGYTTVDVTISGEGTAVMDKLGVTDVLPEKPFYQAHGKDVGHYDTKLDAVIGQYVFFTKDGTPINKNNFEFSFELTKGGLDITPAPLTIAVQSETKAYGEADPEFKATVTGLVEGETVDYTIEREAGEDPGEYEIFVKNIKFSAPQTADDETGKEMTAKEAGTETIGNYDVTIPKATLTITAPANSSSDDPADDSSSETKTGDSTNILGLLAMMTAAALGLFALVSLRRRED